MSRRSGFFIFALIYVAGCGRPVLSLEDSISDGKNAHLVAHVEREPLFLVRRDVSGVPVKFYVNDQLVGETKTDEDGRAEVTYPLTGGDVKEFTAHAEHSKADLKKTAPIYYWDPNRVCIAVDIDETISQTDYSSVIFKDVDHRSRPLKGARAALQHLSDEFQILYITARPRSLLPKTRQWLSYREFPPGPLVGGLGFRTLIDQSGLKTHILTSMREQWPNLRIGIGDRGCDVKAFNNCEMLGLIISDDPETRWRKNAVILSNWTQAGSFFEEHRGILIDHQRLMQAITSAEKSELLMFNGGTQ